ncbi:hypothetical protein ACFOUP_12460 [Belliella kenyensis]|uniref:Uncharacterized protein n=1 Tax=Belliella kenyensis TaxID=1472724 RepID=A0ABV8ELK4_9BACT|nr:hypothetical protein [Belliella kenyensis]MCH7400784.1 hypothetical protein [Belliella kenyensis]MDN3601928.1 hypothetical protein [Belliella kenyensis]
MKNYLKTSKWLRWTTASAFGVMLVLNIMVSLEFEKGKLLPSITLTELGNRAYAQEEGPIYDGCYGNNNEVNFHIYTVRTKFCGSGPWGQSEVQWEDCDVDMNHCCPMMDLGPEPSC